jgi:hypothetical protein
MASELFLYEPKIQDIVNDTSSTLESMKERLMLTLPEIYPDAINQLIRRIDDQLLEVIIASRPGEVIDRVWPCDHTLSMRQLRKALYEANLAVQ